MKPVYLLFLLSSSSICQANPADSLTLTHIGTVCAQGTYQNTNGTQVIYGSGAGIWNVVDEFDFANIKLAGDMQIVARLKSAQLYNNWVKAGVMIREGLYPLSKHGCTHFYGNNTFTYQGRAFNGADCNNGIKVRNLQPPYWVKLIRKASLMISQISADGLNWNTVCVETIEMPDSLYYGLAVASTSGCNASRVEFDSVSISKNTEPLSPEIQKLIIINKRFHSTYVNDDFMIFINLPLSYDSLPEKRYPVVYYLDGNCPDYHNNLRSYAASNLIPEVISVSIGYPGVTQRTRDYTSGFSNFHLFMKNELLPYIDAQYRTNPLNRTLFGNSFGGICSLFTLFQYFDPKNIPFQNIIVSSPSIWWPSDGQATFALERNLYHTTQTLPVNLYMTIGSEETTTMISDFYRMSDTLVSRHYKSFNFNYKLDEGQTHTSNSNFTFNEGIPWILNQPLPEIIADQVEVEQTPIITYLNINNHLLTIDFGNSGLRNGKVELLNTLGQVMYSKVSDLPVLDIDVSGMERGIYVVSISLKTKHTLLKVILQ